MIQFVDVTKRFGGSTAVTALDNISLTIGRAEMVSIVGPSGSGKSTLLHLMGALDRPTTGTVIVDGQSLGTLSDDGLTALRRQKIGFIFQFFNLLPTLTCLENVALPLNLAGWPAKKARERAATLLELVRLGNRLSHRPEQLSGGQRQRVAIARALASNPPIILADEPTGNLDSRTGEEILQVIAGLHDQLWATVVIVTHDINVARRCDRIITIRDGRIESDVVHRRSPGSSAVREAPSSSPGISEHSTAGRLSR
jgi:putative ABC transport system ATP-binding protein